MTTTISVSTKRQVVLPKSFCERKNIKPGSALRVTEVGQGLYVTAVPEPSEAELKEVLQAAGSLARRQTREDEKLVDEAIANYRAERRAHKR